MFDGRQSSEVLENLSLIVSTCAIIFFPLTDSIIESTPRENSSFLISIAKLKSLKHCFESIGCLLEVRTLKTGVLFRGTLKSLEQSLRVLLKTSLNSTI